MLRGVALIILISPSSDEKYLPLSVISVSGSTVTKLIVELFLVKSFADDNNSIRRRRVCDECDKRFTTYEKVETIPLIVIKKDNNRETYDRAKIEAGVLRACHKRPISADQISKLVDDVETMIFSREEKEISSNEIGEMVMEKLKDLEAVAYVRFASVYREFKDVNTFMDELKKMMLGK